MNLEEVLRVVAGMKEDGIVEEYAVGGAVAATFYLEPVRTFDIDIFVVLTPAPGSFMITLDPIFSYLLGRGCTVSGEHVTVAGWPVQFLAAPGPLVEDALKSAVRFEVGGTAVRVFSAEHLAAIALETGRVKDKARLHQFIESGLLDDARFRELVARHGLLEKWAKFERQYLRE